MYVIGGAKRTQGKVIRLQRLKLRLQAVSICVYLFYYFFCKCLMKCQVLIWDHKRSRGYREGSIFQNCVYGNSKLVVIHEVLWRFNIIHVKSETLWEYGKQNYLLGHMDFLAESSNLSYKVSY